MAAKIGDVKAVRIYAHGGPEQLIHEEASEPSFQANEVLGFRPPEKVLSNNLQAKRFELHFGYGAPPRPDQSQD